MRCQWIAYFSSLNAVAEENICRVPVSVSSVFWGTKSLAGLCFVKHMLYVCQSSYTHTYHNELCLEMFICSMADQICSFEYFRFLYNQLLRRSQHQLICKGPTLSTLFSTWMKFSSSQNYSCSLTSVEVNLYLVFSENVHLRKEINSLLWSNGCSSVWQILKITAH